MKKRKGLKTIGIFLIVIILLALILWAAWTWFMQRAYPQTNGSIEISGLQQPVEILRDEFGVAHITAHTTEDLFFAEGYVHAQERFWQMEFQRRVGAGRLSEIFGKATLDTDLYLRHFGFEALSEELYGMLDDESRLVMDSYAQGVNAYISSREPAQLGLEFALLGLQGVEFEIEPYTPVDSLMWGYMMMFDQSDQMRTELRNIQQLSSVGWDMYAYLHPEYREDRPAIIPTKELAGTDGAVTASFSGLGRDEIEYLKKVAGGFHPDEQFPAVLANLGFGASGGSNSYAISGERTTSGAAILANDPHMGVNTPAIWYEIGLHCVEKSEGCNYNLRGFSLAGIPGLLIGHNDRIAWGLTNAAFDAEDVFIERINPQNPNQYEVNGKWVDMDIRKEVIDVQGWDEPKVILVRSTRNGVVATDGMIDQTQFSHDGDSPELYALTYAWTALKPAQSIRAVLMVLRAGNWDEFLEGLQFFEAGKQNWLYADVDGNIGYKMPGIVPIRAGGDGTLPVPGWNDDYEWIGAIPFHEAPQVFNPQQGYIATANNPQIRPGEYPYLIAMEQDRGQRAKRAVGLIEGDTDGISIQDLAAIQTDNQNLSTLEVLPYLKDISFEEPEVSGARDWLLDWDAQMLMDSPQAALYNIFWVSLLRETFHDQLPPDAQPNGDHATSDTVYLLLQETDNTWWDDINTGKVENRDDILK